MTIPRFHPKDFADYSRPELIELLQAIGLDIVYERGEGDSLFYRDKAGDEVRVLDMLGGFGVSLFGHNYPQLVETACAILQGKRPFVAQGSIRGLAGTLAKRLSDRVEASTGQSYMTTFANSGAEAVEAALKHAAWEKLRAAETILANIDRTFRDIRTRQRTGNVAVSPQLLAQAESLLYITPIENLTDLEFYLRQHNERLLSDAPCYLAIKGAFHGKTTGAVQLTYNPDFRLPWQHLGLKAVFTPLNDLTALATILGQQQTSYLDLNLGADGNIELVERPWSRIVACLAEPILGEGGIFPLTAVFLQALRSAADNENFPLILDEIQSGMGRTGTFLASEPSGVVGDYYLFSKALGSGLAKISALLVAKDRYIKRFGYVHTSTFADDDFSSAIALRGLELLEEEAIPSRCQQAGNYLLTQLQFLQQQYPNVIKEVRGRGLLLGIELMPLANSPSRLLQVAAQQHMLGFLFSGYLLHEHHIRVTPTISATNTIRIEPSAFIAEADMDHFCEAFRHGVELLSTGNTNRFLRFLTGAAMDKPNPDIANATSIACESTGKDACFTSSDATRKVACIVHFLEPEDLLRFDPTLAPLTAEQCSRLLAQTQLVIEPFVVGEQTIETPVGEAVHLSVIGIPYTSDQIAARQRQNRLEPVLTAIDQGVELAKEMGCSVIGMTGYTSIVTQNCTRYVEDRVALTSGNSLTAAAAVTAIQQLAAANQLNPATSPLAIVGGVGNIGAVLSEIMLDSFTQLRLIGRSGAARRLNRLSQKLKQHNPAAQIDIGTDMYDLADCQVIISATNAPQPIIQPRHIGCQPTIVCDVAVPADVAPQLAGSRPQAQVVRGGRFQLPMGQTWQIKGMDSDREAYVCVVETILLGLAGRREHFSYGALEATKVRQMQRLAAQYGFELAIQLDA
ncbi:MAG: aminotransferase class III-fold pyridoxal phosphate-dependent enzyme [Chloroflexota bacterium]